MLTRMGGRRTETTSSLRVRISWLVLLRFFGFQRARVCAKIEDENEFEMSEMVRQQFLQIYSQFY